MTLMEDRPPQDTKASQEYRDALEAERLMHNELVGRMFTAIEKAYIKDWKAALEPAEQHMYWAKVRALDDLRKSIQIIAEKKKYLDKQIEEQQKKEAAEKARKEKQQPKPRS